MKAVLMILPCSLLSLKKTKLNEANNDHHAINNALLPPSTSTPKQDRSHRSHKNVNNDNVNNDVDDEFPSCFLLMDYSILYSLISVLACCPSCHSRDIDLKMDLSKKKGLSVLLEIKCNSCIWENTMFTSRKVSNDSSSGSKPFEVNMRAIIAMREIGKGYTALEKNVWLFKS